MFLKLTQNGSKHSILINVRNIALVYAATPTAGPGTLIGLNMANPEPSENEDAQELTIHVSQSLEAVMKMLGKEVITPAMAGVEE